MFTDEDAKRVNSMSEFEQNSSKLQSIQIQRVSTRSYSSSTKLNLIPSIPFKFRFNGQDIDVRRMTLYHPCPVRIENRQYDAVLSLNDPVDSAATHIVLIPLEGVSIGGGPSANFFGKIASYIPGILRPNSDGAYESIDVPTGAGWDLSSIIQTEAQGTTNTVKSGYFVWTGEPPYERYLKETIPGPFQDTIVYGWRPSGGRRPTYIMMQYPSKIGAFDLQTIRMLPVTPSEEAIHPIPANYYYKTGPAPKGSAQYESCKSKKKEKFTVKGEENCDPFAAMPPPSRMSTDDMMNIIIGVLSAVAVFIGVYFALKYATGPLGDFFKKVGEKLGRAMGGMKKEIKAMVPSGAVSIPKLITPIVSEDTKKSGEEFAYKQSIPMQRSQTQRRKEKERRTTFRNKPEFEQVNPMKLKPEERKQIERAEPPPQPDIRRPERVGDIRKTQRTLQTFKAQDRQRTQKNRTALKTAEADKQDIAKLEEQITDAAGTGLLSAEEMKIPPEQRKIFNNKVVKKRIIAEELPDEELTEVKDLVSQKQEAEKKVAEDKQKGFQERLAADREKVAKIDEKIKEQKASIREATRMIRDRRRKTARAILEEAKRRKKEEEAKKETKLPQLRFRGPLPKGLAFPVGESEAAERYRKVLAKQRAGRRRTR